jgi:hypothetical protein
MTPTHRIYTNNGTFETECDKIKIEDGVLFIIRQSVLIHSFATWQAIIDLSKIQKVEKADQEVKKPII